MRALGGSVAEVRRLLCPQQHSDGVALACACVREGCVLGRPPGYDPPRHGKEGWPPDMEGARTRDMTRARSRPGAGIRWRGTLARA